MRDSDQISVLSWCVVEIASRALYPLMETNMHKLKRHGFATLRLLALALVTNLVGCNAATADIANPVDVIVPTDPRFNVFELSNSAGDRTYAASNGTVLLSFATKDLRYCRAARMTSDNTVVLACREERGWKIEATSNLTQGESTNATVFGGGNMQEINDAVQALRANAELLSELGIIEAAAKGWRDPVPVDEQALDARAILKRTAQVYRASKSYIDTGTVKTKYIDKTGERIGVTSFNTAYVAPFDFRFESNMLDFGIIEVGFIVWRDRNGVETWLSVDPERDMDTTSIQDALDEGAGISRDSSGMIPGLIFPGTKLGGDIVRLSSPVRLEDEQIDSFDCFQVQGFRWPNSGEPTLVWIDKESYLIRKVYEEGKIKGGATKTTWHYEPAINVPAAADDLLFNKPTSR